MNFTPIIKPKTVGERIKDQRERLGLERYELADLCAVTVTCLDRMETTNLSIELEMAVILARELKVNLLWLATGEGKRAKTQTKKGSQ